MESINIVYRIKLSDTLTEEFDYEMDAETLEIISAPEAGKLPSWTALGFKQCPNCPLKPEEHPHCPMAVQLHHIVERFHTTCSIDEVELEVITEQRKVSQTTALQNAISSLLSLVFPISGCPRTEGMKPPKGQAWSSVESPRGELGFMVASDGSGKPLRLRARTPSFCNLQAIEHMAVGGLIADLVVVIASIDPVMGDVDR